MGAITDIFQGIKHVVITGNRKDFTRHTKVGSEKYTISQEKFSFPAEAYVTTSDVYAIINKISRASRALPWVLKLKKGDVVEEVTEGIVFDAVYHPNEDQTNHEFREESLIYLLLNGNVFIDKNTSFGSSIPEDVRNLAPQLTHIKTKYSDKRYKTTGYEYSIDGKEEFINKDSVIHIKYVNPSNYGIKSNRGLSPIIAGYLTVKGIKNNQNAHASILDNQGATGIISNESEYNLTPDEQKRQQAEFDNKASGSSLFGKIIQSTSKIKFTKLGLDPTQLKIIEGKVLTMRDLCNIFDITSTLFNDPSNRIQSNVAPAETAFWSNAVIPNDKMIMQAFQRGIINPINELESFANGDGYYLEQDISAIPALQKDQKEEAEKDKLKLEAINTIISMRISQEAKEMLLINELEMSEEEAKAISQPVKIETNEEGD